MSKQWFEADEEGLAKLVAGENKGRLIAELIQNSLDERVSKVDVQLTQLASDVVKVRVEDDSPDGFRDLTDAYTLFAPSYKKGDPTKRGRFNLGEKLIISLCRVASIESTTGTVVFDATGRHESQAKRAVGSVYVGQLPMTKQQQQEAIDYLRGILKPADVRLTINGEDLPTRTPLHAFEATLKTHIGDEHGVLQIRDRKTRIEIYEPGVNDQATIFEMGLPIVATGDRWHVNVLQKVPLNKDRDNVPPGYLKRLRMLVLNEMHARLTHEDVNASWVDEATKHGDCSPEAITKFMDLKFGTNRAAFCPSDPESAKQVAARGGTVIHSRTLHSSQWENVRKAGAIKSAAELYPSPKPYSDGDNAPKEDVVPPSEWTHAMQAGADYATRLAQELMGVDISVKITRAGNNFAACYGDKQLTFNLRTLGRHWFERASEEEIDALIIHEFGHHFSGDHLSEDYYDALCELGAKLKKLAFEKPQLARFVSSPGVSGPLAG